VAEPKNVREIEFGFAGAMHRSHRRVLVRVGLNGDERHSAVHSG
jgi:hypothetical protein